MNRIYHFTSLLSFFLLFFSVSTMAISIQLEQVPNEKKLILQLEQVDKSASFTVTDQAGVIVHQENLRPAPSIRTIIDLELLPEGSYELAIQTSVKEVIQPFVLKSDKLIMKSYLQKEHYNPLVIQHDEYFDVSWLSNRIGSFELHIINPAGEIVFSDEAGSVNRVQRRYRIKHLDRGEYTIRMTTPHRNYYESLTIR
ncbi:MAG: DUF3244 domain-containing protein [Saprospiraceae bacterium]|nr:DUF3244 domain-containing protein [Saprospiraceae bacterium]